MLGHEFSIGRPYGACIVQLAVVPLRYSAADHVDVVFPRCLGQSRARLAVGDALGVTREVGCLHVYIHSNMSILSRYGETVIYYKRSIRARIRSDLSHAKHRNDVRLIEKTRSSPI